MEKHELTAQEIFDISCKNLRKMKARAGIIDSKFDTFSCMYRSPEGPCLVGALIDDNQYLPDMEDKTIGDIFKKDLLSDDYKNLKTNLSLLESLQYLHDEMGNWDSYGFVNWEKMQEIGYEYSLDTSEAHP